MRIAFSTDESTDLTNRIVEELAAGGHEVDALVPATDWVGAGEHVGAAVADGRADIGIVCCWTGTGVSIAANKVDGVRAALCIDAETARGARRWNDANVLALSLRLTSTAVAAEIVEAFLTSEPDDDERPVVERLR